MGDFSYNFVFVFSHYTSHYWSGPNQVESRAVATLEIPKPFWLLGTSYNNFSA